MSGKLSVYDAFVTVGAFILALGLYQHVKPLLSTRAYAAEAGTEVKLGLEINCDEPFMVSQRDWQYLKQVDPPTRSDAIKKLKKQYTSMCKTERIRRSHDDSLNPNLPDPNYLTNNQGHITFKPETGLTKVPDIISTYAYAYDATRTDDPANVTEVGDVVSARPYSYKRCLKVAHPKCCQAAQGGGITDDELSNCHLCNHPNCDHFQSIGPGSDPTLPPFQPGTYKVALQDIGYKDSNYAYAYPANVVDCDKPFSLSDLDDSEVQFLNSLPVKQRPRALAGLRDQFYEHCRIERKRRLGIDERVFESKVKHPVYTGGAGPIFPDDEKLRAGADTASAFAQAYRVSYY